MTFTAFGSTVNIFKNFIYYDLTNIIQVFLTAKYFYNVFCKT